MPQWKAAGRAAREAEDELWKRFRGAQDKFFEARAEVFAERDAALREHAEAKEELLDEAEALLPVTDYRAARSALRGIQERWEAVGPVPRERASSWRAGCGGSRKRSARPRRTSGAGRTPRRGPAPRVPSPSCARRSPSSSSSWPRPGTGRDATKADAATPAGRR